MSLIQTRFEFEFPIINIVQRSRVIQQKLDCFGTYLERPTYTFFFRVNFFHMIIVSLRYHNATKMEILL